MPPTNASAPATPDHHALSDLHGDDLLDAYLAHLAATGRTSAHFKRAARKFFRTWPEPQAWASLPLSDRLAADKDTRPALTFLMLHNRLHPGYDYLLERTLTPFWREINTSPLRAEIDRFLDAAETIGFAVRTRIATGSQVPARLLIQTGRRLEDLTLGDLNEFTAACYERRQRTGIVHEHYLSAISNTHRVLYHLGVLDTLPSRPGRAAQDLDDRLAGVTATIRAEMIAYLERKRATCSPHHVTSIATKLDQFGTFLTEHDPTLTTLGDLDRRNHIEPWLAALTQAARMGDGEPLTAANRNRRVTTVATFLTDISEWGWDAAPSRKVLFREDIPRLPKVLPRYLPVDVDRRLTAALTEHPVNELAALAIRLQRACGLRIGELLDLELDCVHEIDGNGAWLKVPLGKLDTERMVPLDTETLDLVDRIIEVRSHGRPIRHPRYRRPAQFLLTHHGRRISNAAIREELNRATQAAGLEHITTHQLRHTYATALVNAGVSLQSLMALLGHASAGMSLRYGRLFDTTVRREYDRALELAKTQAPRTADGPASTSGQRVQLPLADITGGKDWRTTPLLKSRMAGGLCLRTPAQGACSYANICEHCPSYRTEPSSLPILAVQRVDAEALAHDAEQRGWISEAQRHHQLIERLDALIAGAKEAS